MNRASSLPLSKVQNSFLLSYLCGLRAFSSQIWSSFYYTCHATNPNPSPIFLIFYPPLELLQSWPEIGEKAERAQESKHGTRTYLYLSQVPRNIYGLWYLIGCIHSYKVKKILFTTKPIQTDFQMPPAIKDQSSRATYGKNDFKMETKAKPPLLQMVV